MEVGARNFPEAVRELAQECGVEVPQTRPESPAEKEERTRKKTLTRRLLDIQDMLTAFYSDNLYGPRGQIARNYLSNRGVSVRAAQAFRLGWATGDKAAFARFIDEKSISLDDCITLGLVMEPKGDGILRTSARRLLEVSRTFDVSGGRLSGRCDWIQWSHLG